MATAAEPARQRGALVAAAAVSAGLRKRPLDRRTRQQVVPSNLAITATVLIGVLALYAALLVLSLAAALVLVVPHLFAGALGAGLETDEAVREAAYTHRASEVDLE